MKMPTSSYFTAFQSARALWKWIRRRDDEDEATAEQQQRLNRANHDREVAMVRAGTRADVERRRAESLIARSEAEAKARALRLAPVMKVFETVQANKRARTTNAERTPMESP
ncbi:MAG TPA: hypothetical protein HA353_06020 [Candidatus Poseidonia sp.]|nr:hypothetical protein [Poseidonia sp.]